MTEVIPKLTKKHKHIFSVSALARLVVGVFAMKHYN